MALTQRQTYHDYRMSYYSNWVNGYALVFRTYEGLYDYQTGHTPIDWELILVNNENTFGIKVTESQYFQLKLNGSIILAKYKHVNLSEPYSRIVIHRGQTRLKHNLGTGYPTANFEFSWTPNVENYYPQENFPEENVALIGTANVGGNITYTNRNYPLDSSTLTLSSSVINFGDYLTINGMNKTNRLFDVTIKVGGYSQTYLDQWGTSKQYQVPLSWAYACAESTYMYGTIIVQPKIESEMGAKGEEAWTYEFTVQVPASETHTVSLTRTSVVQPSGITAYTTPVVGVSTVTYRATFPSVTSGRIEEIRWTTDGASKVFARRDYDGTFDNTDFSFIPQKTSQTITCTTRDSRGTVVTQTATLTSTAYSPPTLSLVSSRCNSGATLDQNGLYIYFTPTFTYTALGTYNEPTIDYSLNLATPISGSGTKTTYPSGTKTAALGANLVLAANAYTLTVTVTDKVGKAARVVHTIPKAASIFHFPATADRVGLGTSATKASYFQLGYGMECYGAFGRNAGTCSNFDTALTESQMLVSGTSLTGAPYTGAIAGKLSIKVNDGTVHNNSTNTIWQTFVDTSNRTYMRCKVNAGAWGSWAQSVSSANMAAMSLTYAFPVGSMYMTKTNTNPGTFLGGTWVAFTNTLGIYMWERTA